MKFKFTATVLLLIITVFSCTPKSRFERRIIAPVRMEMPTDDVQRERDAIWMLLSYSLVYLDWQPDSLPRNKRRGYNIGSVLVNKNNEPVAYDLNSINSTNNTTQHGEVRLITNYIEKTKCYNLDGYAIYTTLEPCIMCAGMITMTSVQRVVYGQLDVEFSKAFERLAIDTRPIGGFGPYPRSILATASSLPLRKELDDLYAHFLATEKEKVLARFLASEKAREAFAKAPDQLLHYAVKQASNQAVLESAVLFFKKELERKGK